jgi:hypothetical protein
MTPQDLLKQYESCINQHRFVEGLEHHAALNGVVNAPGQSQKGPASAALSFADLRFLRLSPN